MQRFCKILIYSGMGQARRVGELKCVAAGMPARARYWPLGLAVQQGASTGMGLISSP